jgi:hypothetical protein
MESIGPLPVDDFWPIDTMLVGVMRKGKAIHLVVNGKLQRAIDSPLLPSPTRVQVPRVRTPVRQVVNEPVPAMKVEDERLAAGAQAIEVSTGSELPCQPSMGRIIKRLPNSALSL